MSKITNTAGARFAFVRDTVAVAVAHNVARTATLCFDLLYTHPIPGYVATHRIDGAYA